MRRDIITFGDGAETLDLVGFPRTARSAHSPIVALGVFRVPEAERAGDFRALKRAAQASILNQVEEHDPDVLAIALDVTGRLRQSKAAALGRNIALETAYTASLITDGELWVVSVLIRSHEERERLVNRLLDGRFHQVVTEGWPVVNATRMRGAPPHHLVAEGGI